MMLPTASSTPVTLVLSLSSIPASHLLSCSFRSSLSLSFTIAGAKIVQWNVEDGATEVLTGKNIHKSGVTDATISEGNLVTISVDDTIKFTPVSTLEYTEGIKLDSQPRSLGSRGSTVVIGTVDSLVVFNGNNKTSSLSTGYVANAVAISVDGTEVAVGASDNKVYVYSLSGGKLSLKHTLDESRGEITSVDYSPNGVYLGVGDANREVKVYKEKESVVSGWVFHNSRVSSVSWSPDSTHIVSGSVDTQIIVWNVSDPGTRVTMKVLPLLFVDSLSALLILILPNFYSDSPSSF